MSVADPVKETSTDAIRQLHAEPSDHGLYQVEPVFAFLYKGLRIPLAAGVLYPFFGILLSPMIAAAAMSFSSV